MLGELGKFFPRLQLKTKVVVSLTKNDTKTVTLLFNLENVPHKPSYRPSGPLFNVAPFVDKDWDGEGGGKGRILATVPTVLTRVVAGVTLFWIISFSTFTLFPDQSMWFSLPLYVFQILTSKKWIPFSDWPLQVHVSNTCSQLKCNRTLITLHFSLQLNLR